MAKRLLVIMSHPDDAEILVGGILFHLKNIGWELGIVTMTQGDCGSTTHSKEEIMRIRRGEAEAAAGYLGAWYAWAGMMDAEIFANRENLRKIVEVMRRFDPDVVITHSPADYMVDHEETSRLARSASFIQAAPLYVTHDASPAPPARATPALYYADPVEGAGPMGERIYPDFYVDISEPLSKKREMLAFHASQREWLRQYHGIEYLERMTEWAAECGRECGFSFAEGFRQHLGHAYPREPVLQEALKRYVRMRK